MELHSDWLNWQWQIRHSVRDAKRLGELIELTHEERVGVHNLASSGGLPLRITPYFFGLIDKNDPNDPIRLQVIPRQIEFNHSAVERRDPLGEEEREVVPHLVHRYPDRVLLLITDRCASYCRFCTRKRWIGQGPTPTEENLSQALNYIQTHPQIKEVIVSGGDPLLLSNERLESLLSRLRKIETVEVIRLHTRMFSFAPMRVEPKLVEILRAHNPVYVVAHINHPNELGKETEQALTTLADSGVVVLNQSVLLKGINDSAEVLGELFRKLVKLRARPYYLHQCDVVTGASHFRVPIERALKIMNQLQGNISGLCLPAFVIDVPGGHGKVRLWPDSVVKKDEKEILLKGFDGHIAAYPLH